jgi:hypothetical protein
MKKYFMVSLCKHGILGGGIVADEEAITYCTGKLTIPDKYKRIEMKYKDITSVASGRMFIFPTVTLNLSNGENFKFIVFAREKLVDTLRKNGVSE